MNLLYVSKECGYYRWGHMVLFVWSTDGDLMGETFWLIQRFPF